MHSVEYLLKPYLSDLLSRYWRRSLENVLNSFLLPQVEHLEL